MDVMPNELLIGVEYTIKGNPHIFRIIRVEGEKVDVIDPSNDRRFAISISKLWDKHRVKVGTHTVFYEIWV